MLQPSSDTITSSPGSTPAVAGMASAHSVAYRPLEDALIDEIGATDGAVWFAAGGHEERGLDSSRSVQIVREAAS